MIKTRILAGYQDTRTNNEDFALTPYLFSVIENGKVIKLYGFGLCWGYFSVYVALGFNVPDSVPSVMIIKKKTKS